MKFKHIKHYNKHTSGGSLYAHYKYIKVWNIRDEIQYQIKNGYSTKGLGYDKPWSKCDVPYDTNWYKQISSNKKLIKKMWDLRIKYLKGEKNRYDIIKFAEENSNEKSISNV